MNTNTFGDISINPGEITQGKLGTVYLSVGTAVDIPLMVIRGEQDGPVLWLGAAMHGQEVAGIPVIWEVIKERLDPKILRGTVVGAPLLNPLSFNGGTYFTPQDGYNFNRVFPGSSTGLLTQRMANMVYEEGVKKCDYMIDFHCNTSTAMCFTIIDEPKDDTTYEKYRLMAEAFGLTIIQATFENESHRTGLMSTSAVNLNKPIITIELTPWHLVDQKTVKVGVRGTLNVLKSLGMIDGEIELQEDVQLIEGEITRTEITCTRGGLVMEYVEVGDEIKKGQLIGQVVDVYGDPVEDIISSADGWLLAWPMVTNQAAGSGDFVAFIAYRK